MMESLDLLFRTQGELPGSPLAQIYVKNYTQEEDKKFIFITAHCFSLNEIEEEINRLMSELENIRKKAKRKFAKER